MISNLAAIIGKMIFEHQIQAVQDNRVSRLLVPGLTHSIASDIHSYLRQERERILEEELDDDERDKLEKGLLCYLLSGDNPVEENQIITPGGQVSIRNSESYVFIASPDQFSNILKSVLDTVRSPIYLENSPWLTNKSEIFSFKEEILPRLVKEWGVDREDEKNWFNEFIHKIAIYSTKSRENREEILLDKILDDFNLNRYSSIAMEEMKILYHMGIPKPDYTEIREIDELKKDMQQLYSYIDNRLKEIDIRSQVTDRIPEVFSDSTPEDIEKADQYLNTFLDSLMNRPFADSSLLGFFECWDNIEQWTLLTAEKLRELFEIPKGRNGADIRLDVQLSGKTAVVSDDRKSIATFYGNDININVSWEIPEDCLPTIVSLKRRTKVFCESEVSQASGEIDWTIPIDDSFGKHDKSVVLTLILTPPSQHGKPKMVRLRIHICGPQRERYALIKIKDSFTVLDSSDDMPNEPTDIIDKVDLPKKIYIFSWEGKKPTIKDHREKEIDIVQSYAPGPNLWETEPIDVEAYANNKTVITCDFNTVSSGYLHFTLVTTGSNKGEFTLEDELRVAILNSTPAKRKILNNFDRSDTNLHGNLGKLEKAINRIALAKEMTKELGWKPLIVDLDEDYEYKEITSCGGYINSVMETGPDRFTDLEGDQLDSQAHTLIQQYQIQRFKIIEKIKESFNPPSKNSIHPIYASHPIYIHHDSGISSLIQSYLDIYTNILDYAKSSQRDLSFEERFVLVHLDHAVHLGKDEDPFNYLIALQGPWHPLVIAKRYMVQACLYKRGKRIKDDFRNLISLLKGISGNCWIPGIRTTTESLESMYTVPTSDPGWQVATKQNFYTQESHFDVLFKMTSNLGLEILPNTEEDENLAAYSLKNFGKAFPSRRSLGILVNNGYSIPQTLSSIQNLLRESDTDLAQQLNGGVRISFKEKCSDEDLESLDTEIDSPILIYHNNKGDSEDSLYPDINLVQPRQNVEFVSVSDPSSVPSQPRGLGDSIVFSNPVRKIGGSIPPSSESFEIDRYDSGRGMAGTLEDTYSRVLAKISEVCPPHSIVRSLQLPDKLKAPWAVIPGDEIDPSVLIQYINQKKSDPLAQRALWDYRVDISGSKNTSYVLSQIPKSFSMAVDGFIGNTNLAEEFIVDLGKIGISIGGEALKSGRHGIGVIGLVGAIRLAKFMLRTNENSCGLLIPVDPFASFFSDASDDQNFRQRGDLLAIQLELPERQDGNLIIKICSVEAKCVSGTFSEDMARSALEQAQSSVKKIQNLINRSLDSDGGGMPERLGLLRILDFGLRIKSVEEAAEPYDWQEIEAKVARLILEGKYRFNDNHAHTMVVSTELGMQEDPQWRTPPEGQWIRINKQHWPGVANTDAMDAICEQLGSIFVPTVNNIRPTPIRTEPVPENNPPLEPLQPTSEENDSWTEPEPVDVDAVAEPPQTTPKESDNEVEPTPLPENNAPTELPQITPEASEAAIFLGREMKPPYDRIYIGGQENQGSIENRHLMICGSSGKGKTQLIKYLACQLRARRKNILILDFKNDFASDPYFAAKGNMKRVFVNFDGLPFNPLVPYPIAHPATGESVLQIGQHISGTSAIFKRIYGLGPQQESAVKNAIREAFKEKGMGVEGNIPYDENIEYPDLNQVGAKLKTSTPAAYNRLDPLFTLGLFQEDKSQHSFDELADESMILNLSQISSDLIKNALAELLILAAHSYYNSKPHSGTLRQVMIFDEAHRILQSNFMELLIREGRAYGVGIFLSSQNPSDFPNQISNSMATKILHGNGSDREAVRNIARLLGLQDRDAEISRLGLFEAFVHNAKIHQKLCRTMNYPAFLLWSYLSEQEESRFLKSELLNQDIDGLNTAALSLNNLLKQLEQLGITEEKDGYVVLLRNVKDTGNEES